MLSFITLPSPTTTIADVGTWSSPMFSALIEPALAVAGMFVGIVILILVYNGIVGGFNSLFHKDEEE